MKYWVAEEVGYKLMELKEGSKYNKLK
jgi:hypothetical protein